MRLDQELAARGLARSRSHARQLIEEGHVTVNGLPVIKPAHSCDSGDVLAVTGGYPYVSRGGVKLERALDVFAIEVSGIAAVDIGASTGGFTHCLLTRGAKRVYAVDVGRDQLEEGLRHDSRVISLEQTDVRTLTPAMVGGGVSLAVCDVSFISLRLVLPCVAPLLLPGGQAICLIKPQFEAGREHVGKGGVVRDQRAHLRVLESLREADGLRMKACIPSPVRGGDGNIEYLALLDRSPDACPDLAEAVRLAFMEKSR